jgi:hypothetical protein
VKVCSAALITFFAIKKSLFSTVAHFLCGVILAQQRQRYYSEHQWVPLAILRNTQSHFYGVRQKGFWIGESLISLAARRVGG